MGSYTFVASTLQCTGCVILFKLSKGFTVVWVLVFYSLDMCNTLIYHISHHLEM